MIFVRQKCFGEGDFKLCRGKHALLAKRSKGFKKNTNLILIYETANKNGEIFFSPKLRKGQISEKIHG